MTLGIDISGGYDLDPAMREVSGLRALGEAIVRRLTTTAGALQDHPSYGFNLDSLIGTSKTDTQIKQGVEGQVFAEEEVDDARVTIQRDGSTITILIAISAGEGPFELTLSVDEVGVSAIIPANL